MIMTMTMEHSKRSYQCLGSRLALSSYCCCWFYTIATKGIGRWSGGRSWISFCCCWPFTTATTTMGSKVKKYRYTRVRTKRSHCVKKNRLKDIEIPFNMSFKFTFQGTRFTYCEMYLMNQAHPPGSMCALALLISTFVYDIWRKIHYILPI